MYKCKALRCASILVTWPERPVSDMPGDRCWGGKKCTNMMSAMWVCVCVWMAEPENVCGCNFPLKTNNCTPQLSMIIAYIFPLHLHTRLATPPSPPGTHLIAALYSCTLSLYILQNIKQVFWFMYSRTGVCTRAVHTCVFCFLCCCCGVDRRHMCAFVQLP